MAVVKKDSSGLRQVVPLVLQRYGGGIIYKILGAGGIFLGEMRCADLLRIWFRRLPPVIP